VTSYAEPGFKLLSAYTYRWDTKHKAFVTKKNLKSFLLMVLTQFLEYSDRIGMIIPYSQCWCFCWLYCFQICCNAVWQKSNPRGTHHQFGRFCWSSWFVFTNVG